MNKIVVELEQENLDCISQALRVYYGFLMQSEDNAYGSEARKSFNAQTKNIEQLISLFESLKTA